MLILPLNPCAQSFRQVRFEAFILKTMVIMLFEGLIDEGESPEQAAIRELEEETGTHLPKLYSFFRSVKASP